MIFVTGAAGFIGSNFVHHLASKGYDDIIILDKLSYAANMDNLFPFKFPVKVVDLVNKNHLEELFEKYEPDIIFHFAIENSRLLTLFTLLWFFRSYFLGPLNELLMGHFDLWQLQDL